MVWNMLGKLIKWLIISKIVLEIGFLKFVLWEYGV